jgi:chemotaxis protein MotB
MKSVIYTALTTVALLSTGCVSTQTHEAALLELDKTKESLSTAEHTIAQQHAQIEANSKEIARTKSELAALKNKRNALQQEFDEAQNRLSVSQSKLETMRQIEAETKKTK